MPNDHTSDLIVNRPYSAASGAVHLIGNLAPADIGKTDTQFTLGHASFTYTSKYFKKNTALKIF